MYLLIVNTGTVIAGITFIIMIFLVNKNFRRTGLITSIFAVSMISSSIGGQLLRKLTHWNWMSYEEFIINLKEYEGTHFLGRVLIAVVIYILLWKFVMKKEKGVFNKFGLTKSLDIISFFMVIQHFFNRVGCLTRGCCYGKAHHGFFSIYLPQAGLDYPVYPTQPFEMFGMVMLLIYITIRYKRDKTVFPFFCIGFGLVIFVSEFFMDQTGTVLFLGMSFVQIAAVVLVMLGIIYQYRIKKGGKGA